MVMDTLLASLALKTLAFADDFKFVVDVIEHTRQEVQDDIDQVVQWSEAHEMPLSIEKCGVLHCGKNQPFHQYNLGGQPLPIVDELTDLGVVRTADSTCTRQCQAVAAKATRAACAIRRAFQRKYKQLMWPAFTRYVLPIVMYCAPAWSPTACNDINAIEKIQRRFTKAIRGLKDLSYAERLSELGTLSLQNRRIYADMGFMYKIIHGMVDCSASDLGVTSCDRGRGMRAVQRRPVSKACASLFACRAPSKWNKLPAQITASPNLNIFKSNLFKHLQSA